MNENRGKRVTHFEGFLKGIINHYDEACGLIHGFQKDAIQNGWGHRRLDRPISEWKMIFKYVENDKGHFLIVEDCGDTGLIGKNYSNADIEQLQSNGLLGENEKLARFSSLYNSGDNSGSAGLYGQGKLMYQAVSKSMFNYFDSFTQEGKYVANYFDKDDINDGAFEGENAINYIKEKTGLDRKTTTGTRVIIVDPKDELILALRDGSLINDINETWWRIIDKYNASIELYDGDKMLFKASVPEVYKKYYSDPTHSEIYKVISIEPGYRIAKMGFLYVEDENELLMKSSGSNDLKNYLGNVAYYRKDMKIGNICELDSLNLDPKIKNRISGFFELDVDWEDKLKDIENQTHYSVSNGKKNKKEYQKMKTALNKYLNEFLEKKGLKKKNTYVDPNENLKELASDLTDFLKDCNLDLDLSPINDKGKIKPLQITCEKLYPNANSRTIEYGQEMKLIYKIKRNISDYNYNVSIIFTDENGKDRIYSSDDIVINSNEYESDLIQIPYNDFFEENKNLVKVLVTSKSNSDVKAAYSFSVFAGKDDEEEPSDIIFRLNSIDLPDPVTRRINFNEKINKIELKIINNLNQDYTVGISGFIQDVNDRNYTVDTIYKNPDIYIKGNSEMIITINDILFGEKFLNKKGPMRIKFKLSHMDGLNKKKGEELKEVFTTVMYEEDLPSNTANLFEVHTDDFGDTKIKSRLDHNGDLYDLVFNTDYVMYKFVPEDKTDPFYKEYYSSEMLRTLLKIKFENGDYSFIGCDDESIKALDAKEITDRANDFVNSYMSQYFEMRG